MKRSAARIVGLINTVVSLLFTLTDISVMVVLAHSYANNVNVIINQNYSIQESEITISWRSPNVYFWMTICMLIGFTSLHVAAIWKLFRGTKKGVDAKDGLRSCNIWRGIAVFFLIKQMVQCIIWFFEAICATQVIFTLMDLFRHVFTLYCVQLYMNKLSLSLPKFLSINSMLVEPSWLEYENGECKNAKTLSMYRARIVIPASKVKSSLI